MCDAGSDADRFAEDSFVLSALVSFYVLACFGVIISLYALAFGVGGLVAEDE